MAIVDAVVDFFRSLKFYDIVDVAEIGLHFRRGNFVEHEIRNPSKNIPPEKLEAIIANEEAVRKAVLPESASIPFDPPLKPPLPKGYRWVKDKVLSDERFDVNLRAGGYWTIPLIDIVRTQLVHVERLYTPTKTFLTTDFYNVSIQFCIECELLNYAMAYGGVKHWPLMVADDTVTRGLKYCLGRPLEAFADPVQLKEIEGSTLAEMTPIAKEWGVKMVKTDISDHFKTDALKLYHEGTPPLLRSDGSSGFLPAT